MKKGLEPIQWAFVTLVATLAIVVFAVNPLQMAIDQAIANNAELTAQEIRTAINVIQAMPDVSEHVMDLRPRNCKITIDKESITVEIKDTKAILGIIQTDAEIKESTEILCSEKDAIKLTKAGNVIEVE